MKSVELAPIAPGTTVFVRCDLDVPIENSKIIEEFRLENLLPTLKLLTQKQTKIIIGGHMKDQQTTQVLIPYFDKHLGKGNYQLLENLRFNPGEKNNDQAYAQQLSSQADVYVNESFATCHREHASIVGIPQYLPSYAGMRLMQEVENLSKVMKNPKRPLVALIGGAKLESKLPVVNKFLETADAVLLGGKLFAEWIGHTPTNLFLAQDAPDVKDIGEKTIKGFSEILAAAGTIVWAGPMGAYEQKEYEFGTYSVAKAIIDSRAFTIIGGGDTITAVNKFGFLNKFNFVSTGGGAMLDFLAKGNLPGLKALGYNG